MARFQEVTTSINAQFLKTNWRTFRLVFVASPVTALKLQTADTNPFYLSYRTYHKGRGWLPYVNSQDNDYAGYEADDTRYVQAVGIHVYDTVTNAKLDQKYILMYRARVGTEWLPWVSNAKAELMYEVQKYFNLGGELDTVSGNAGLPGGEEVLQGFQFRVFKDNGEEDTDTFTGGEVSVSLSYLKDSTWNSFRKRATDSQIDGIKIQTSSNKDYYLQYKTWNEGKSGYYAAVKSTENDYAGSPGKPIQRLNIQVYKNDGTKLTTGVIVMYRACVDGEWLAWVSNADPEWMRAVQTKYSLGGTLDTDSSYAGTGGKNIEGIEIRIFEDDSEDAGTGSFVGEEAGLSMRYMANSTSNWTSFSGKVKASPIDGLEIKTSGKDYYLSYKTWNEGKTGYYPAVKSTEDDYAGSPGKPIQRLNIQVYRNDGTKLTSDVVVMYRACVDGKWLPWVSNADPEWMSGVKIQYNLDGSLDPDSGYAGVTGKNIEGIEIRVFEGSTLPLPKEELSGAEVNATLSYFKNGSWKTFTASIQETDIDGIKIQTSTSKPYYLLYKTHNSGKTNFYPAVKSIENDYAGASGKPIQKLSIQVYKNDGTKLTTGVVVMYRAYVDGEWLPWVSNADPKWMQAVQVKYALGGRLDTASYYAGIGGKDIEGVEVRVFEENTAVVTPSGNYKIINVPFITQNNSYPTGCESVSTVMALNYAGYDITVEEFIDSYLDKQSFPFDPNEAFGGNPYSSSGYGCYAPVIKKAVDKFLPDTYRARILYNPTLQELCEDYIDNGVPVILWATMDMKSPYISRTWKYNERTIEWIAPEHCLLLVGYDDNHYIFNDPLKWYAPTFYTKEAVEIAYNGLFRQAIVIENTIQTLPDVSDAYRRKKAKEFFASLGLPLGAEFEYGQELVYNLGYFEVRYAVLANMKIEGDPSFEWLTYDVVNGKFIATFNQEMIKDVYNQLGVEVTSEIEFDDAFVGVDFVKTISNGTVKYGVKMTSNNEIVVHVIANEILRESGPARYSQTYQVEMVFRERDFDNPEKEPSFELAEFGAILDLGESTVTNVVTILTLGSVVCLFGYYGGIAGVLEMGKSFLGSSVLQNILRGVSLFLGF